MVGTREPNQKILGQLFANGGGGKATTGADGSRYIVVEAKPDETIWRPSVIMTDSPGMLEIEFSNNNPQNHLMEVVLSDGGKWCSICRPC